MNRNTRNRGGRQRHQNKRSMRHTRNNPLYDNLFDTSVQSRAPSETQSSAPIPALATQARWVPLDYFPPRQWADTLVKMQGRSSRGRLLESMPLFKEVRIFKLTHSNLASYPLSMDSHRRIHIDMWMNSARCTNSINSTMSPPRRPRCASSLSS